jgi:glyoxylase-like metal-dependent hydrolase (beta-lactamase superfamily II)
LDCPVYLNGADSEWLNRKDTSGLRKLIDGPTEEIVPGVTAIKVGGHFDGSMILHWDGMLFHADSIMIVPVSPPTPPVIP